MLVGLDLAHYVEAELRILVRPGDLYRNLGPRLLPLEQRIEPIGRDEIAHVYWATWMAGGCHVPPPGGKIEGASVFGQYNRMTM